jgi:serralysin
MFSKIEPRVVFSLTVAATFILSVPTSRAAFHLWQVKEAYSNADGSVQFIEMFDSFGGETSVGGFTLTANSDGNIKTFTFPSNLSLNTPGSLLIATSGFGSLPGGVTPDFTFNQGGVSGQFFNPNATNLTFTYNGSGDSMAFAGASLPKDGIHALTDAGAVGFPPGVPNISSGVNSPTNLSGQSGSVNLSTPEPSSAMLLSMTVVIGQLRRRRRF